VYTYHAGWPSPDKGTLAIPDPSWAVTVTGGNGEPISKKLWYDSTGLNYTDALGLGFDMCALVINPLPLNTVQLGQSDSGNCSSMFSQKCISALEGSASRSAHQWTTYSTPPPYENLTEGVLPSICDYIANDVYHEAMLNECGPELEVDKKEPKNNNHVGSQAFREWHMLDQRCTTAHCAMNTNILS
jgi:hypothetical protein